MKILLFGATGMIGQAVLRECLLDPAVNQVLAVVRSSTGKQHAKLEEIVHSDFSDYSSIVDRWMGFDACIFALGISSAGMAEEAYRTITYSYTLAAAKAFYAASPRANFIYVSGMGADSSGKGRIMWARVRGVTENTLFDIPFKGVYVFRPAFIQPLHGIKAKTPLYNAFYGATALLFPLWKVLFPKGVTTTELIGRGLIEVGRNGYPKRLLEAADIAELGNSLKK